ncbi:uncharacterized protein LOC128999985 [Macrosteles quadrilineatus]|uniref:uncharacterized protein LOC128999985 n=1 Tax=Macrosteles quadrilineatus TaxID=74068 RepID=UPI0023E31E2D|nr:uncharacterized protein LOC128999985 [Macrosteles quadrilineatus]
MGYITCALVLLLVVLTSSVLAYPWSDSGVPSSLHRTECDTSDDVQTLCQRCAKSTKSNIVYPMCCRDREEARNWCSHYLAFGIQGE